MCSKSNTLEQNNKLKYLSKRLNEMEIAEHFKGGQSRSVYRKNKMSEGDRERDRERERDKERTASVIRSKSRE